MSNDSRNDDFPTIRLDEEDRRDYQHKKHPSSQSVKSSAGTAPAASGKPSAGPTKSGGGNGLWIALVAVVALAGVGGSYYLFQQLELQKKVAADAENRIAQLERKLSATGEEMGESTVALQVKVSELTDKSEELWDQMDKLWASAWRRNQKEITDLGDKLNATENSLKKSINSVTEDVSADQQKLSSLSNQLSGIADEILALNVQLEQATSDKSSQQQTVKNLTEKVSVLENRNASLASRLTSMENEIRDIATKVVVSQPGATSPSLPQGQ